MFVCGHPVHVVSLPGCRYLVGLGTEPDVDNLVPFASAGLRTSYFWSQLSLVPGTQYYAVIKAVDLAGHSTVVSSDGVLVRLAVS